MTEFDICGKKSEVVAYNLHTHVRNETDGIGVEQTCDDAKKLFILSFAAAAAGGFIRRYFYYFLGI